MTEFCGKRKKDELSRENMNKRILELRYLCLSSFNFSDKQFLPQKSTELQRLELEKWPMPFGTRTTMTVPTENTELCTLLIWLLLYTFYSLLIKVYGTHVLFYTNPHLRDRYFRVIRILSTSWNFRDTFDNLEQCWWYYTIFGYFRKILELNPNFIP